MKKTYLTPQSKLYIIKAKLCNIVTSEQISTVNSAKTDYKGAGDMGGGNIDTRDNNGGSLWDSGSDDNSGNSGW